MVWARCFMDVFIKQRDIEVKRCDDIAQSAN